MSSSHRSAILTPAGASERSFALPLVGKTTTLTNLYKSVGKAGKIELSQIFYKSDSEKLLHRFITDYQYVFLT